MRFDLSSRNTKILQEQKKRRQWMIAFLCLSVTVVLGTVAALKLYGQALTHKVKVLDCQAKAHEHTDACYVYDEKKGEDVPVCGYADYLIHIHNDDCYDENGRLVCPLEEIKPHTHTDACYEEQRVLICGLEGIEPAQEGDERTAGSQQGQTSDPESQPAKIPDDGNQSEQSSGAQSQSTQEATTEASATEAPATAASVEATAKTETKLVCAEEEHTHTDDCYGEAALSCVLEEHEHGDDCYETTLTCKTEEHTHKDDCYDENGSLICDFEEHEHGDDCYEKTLTCETEEHTHEDDCYGERELTCKKKEHEHTDACYAQVTVETTAPAETKAAETTAPLETKAAETKAAETTAAPTTAASETTTAAGTGTHVHTDACYETRLVPVCGKLEFHTHDEDCYDEDGQLICELPQLEEHVHNKDCFKTVELTDEEIAALNAGAKLHIHHEDCYDENGDLICGHDETHIHGPKCYDKEGKLICGHDEAHVHGPECYDENGDLTCGLEVVVHEHTDDCYDENGKLICDHAHIHEESCFDENGNMTCDFEDVGDYLWTCEEEDYIVTAKFNHEAKIPGNAKLIAEQITADENAEYFAQREKEYREAMRDETADMRALLSIGFYVENKDAKKEEDKLTEIEPEAPVTITVQFLDDDGLADGEPITVVHFGKEGTELLDGGQAEDNSTTFEMRGFSEIAIGYGDEGAKNSVSGNGIDGNGGSVSGNAAHEEETIHLDNSFEYDAAPFHIVFHVAGEAKAADGQTLVKDQPEIDSELREEIVSSSEAEENEKDPLDLSGAEENQGEKNAGDANDGENTENFTRFEKNAMPASSENNAAEEDTGSGENTDGEENGEVKENAGGEAAYNTEVRIDKEKLELNVESLEDDPMLNDVVTDYFGESTDTIQRSVIYLFKYDVTYDGMELDLSNCKVTTEITLNRDTREAEELLASVSGTSDSGIATVENADEDVVEDKDATDETRGNSGAVGSSTEVSITMFEVEEGSQINKQGSIEFNMPSQVVATSNSNVMGAAAESQSNPTFTVQYYAYAQIMEDKQTDGAEAINIVDTHKTDGLGGATLPTNKTMPKTRSLYVKAIGKSNTYKNPVEDFPNGQTWKIYEPVYKNKESVDSLTELYLADKYEFKEVNSGGLTNINKFAKAGLNYDLVEVWVLKENAQADSINKNDWKIYSGEAINNLSFRNNNLGGVDDNTIVINKDTVIRLVGRSNTTKNKNYPARFFDYDFTDGTNNHLLQGINHPSNYKKDKNGQVKTPRYGFGNNSSGATGLKDDKLNGYNINIANPGTTIIKKCSYGLVESSLSAAGYPVIKANAPDLFNPQVKNVTGRTEVTGYSLNFDRDGDTYTLMSVAGSGNHARNLNQFQKTQKKAYLTDEPIWTNQFWPMDNAPTFGDTAKGHDPKFGTFAQHGAQNAVTTGLAVSDDGNEHNSFFGMNFEVEFKLTDDYVGPLNYYFFGDDDMWVFLEHPDGKTELICDIGGVHQAAGEYVDLWNYIAKPTESTRTPGESAAEGDQPEENEDERSESYKLKFFYTERGASGSTCWMQFTLPSVNAVPVIDYTGNVKSTLTMKKTIDGAPSDEQFDFIIEFSGSADNIALNTYPYEITRKSGKIEKGDIRSGETFKLGNEDTIEIFNLPDGTKYVIKEADYPSYKPVVGEGSSGQIIKDKTVEGNIDWGRDDILNYINKELPYNLPETGGPGSNLYTMAGALCLMFGAGLMYRKKFRGRRV